MIPVYLESPFRGETKEQQLLNIKYARACMADCLKRGESPFASHLLYTQEGILNDDIPAERELGIAAGNIWRRYSHLTVFYLNLGMSEGMEQAREACERDNHPYDLRLLENWE